MMKIFTTAFIFWVGLWRVVGGERASYLDEECPLGGVRDQNSYSYWVNWNRLPTTPWEPGKETFPLDLGAEARKTGMYLIESKGLTNRVDPVIITINRLFVPERKLKAHHKEPAGFTNQWTVSWTFRQFPNLESLPLRTRRESILQLLDGTYASERPPFFAKEGTLSKSSNDEISSQGSGVVAGKTASELYGPESKSPKVKWDPMSGRMPLDLSVEARRLQVYIEEQVRTNEPLVLSAIEMRRFTPDKAQVRPDEEFHWYLIFTFANASSVTEPEYQVWSLLDSTILELKIHPLSPGRIPVQK